MNICENIWLLNSLLIIILVLSTDPKSSTSGIGDTSISFMFSSISESQKFVRNFSWFLVVTFYSLTILINYPN